MRIISKNGEFQLPVGFSAEITSYNQVFNDQGEQSIPVDLPATHHNLLLLGFPNRVDSFFKPIDSLQVDVVDGVFMRPARMSVHSANEQDGISCTLYFREAAFYALIDDMTMQDITLDVIQGVGATLEDKVNYLITVLKNEYINQTSNMFSVFPVQTNHSVTREFSYKVFTNDPLAPSTWTYQDFMYEETGNLILNGFESAKMYEPDASAEKNIYLHTFQGESAQQFIENGTAVSIGKGYGMTAFVDVFYFIQRMFTQLGYSFDDSQLRTIINHTDGKFVMLNNIADAIYDGTLDLNQLVPNLTLKDFLKTISSYLGGVFYVDEVYKRITFYSYTAVFTINIDKDLSKYMSSPLKINSLDFRILELFNTAAPHGARKAETDYIDVSLPGESTLEMQSHGQTELGTGYTHYLRHKFGLSLLTINNVVHLNSSVVKNSEVDASKEKDSSKELVLAGVRKNIYESGSGVYHYSDSDGRRQSYTYHYHYRKGYSSIYRTSEDPFAYLKSLFQPYIDWHRYSNISASCDMHLPPDILYSLDLTKHFIIDGQLFFIDRVKYRLPYDGQQSLTLRTYRKYEDRE